MKLFAIYMLVFLTYTAFIAYAPFYLVGAFLYIIAGWQIGEWVDHLTKGMK